MKKENQSTIDTTGVSAWWFTRNIIIGLTGIVATAAIFSMVPRPSEKSGGTKLAQASASAKVFR